MKLSIKNKVVFLKENIDHSLVLRGRRGTKLMTGEETPNASKKISALASLRSPQTLTNFVGI
jgi:hypothetical protein